jgi:hypothetical protein
MRFFQKLFSDKYYILSDQALVSVMNFGAVFFLSGFLSDTIFSRFVVLFGYITLANTVLTAVFSSPMLVFATKRWSNTQFNYLFSNSVLLVTFGFLLALLEFFFLEKQIPDSPFWLFFMVIIGMSAADMLKRFIFSTKSISLIYAPISSVLVNLIFFGGLFLYKKELTLELILIIYVIAYLVSMLLLTLAFFVLSKSTHVNFKGKTAVDITYNKEIFTTHFHYSKWILLGSVSFWVYTQGIYIYGNVLGVSDFIIAKTRSIQNLFGIFTILIAAMENYLTPLFTAKAIYSEDSIPEATENIYKTHLKKTLLIYLLTIPVMWGVYFMYYQESYGDGWSYIIIMWLTQLIAISTKPIAIALKVKEVTYPLFLSHLYAALMMVLIGYLAITIIGDHGLIMAMLGAYIVANITNYIYYKKVFYNTKK